MSDLFNQPPLSTTAGCNGCKSLEVGQGFASFSKVCCDEFCASTKFPETSLYSTVRSACVRALSGELVPNGTHEEQNKPVLIFSLQVKDL